MDAFSINWRRVAAFIGIALLMLVVIEFNTRIEELNSLTDEARLYRAQATHAMQTNVALQTEIAYATSDAAVDEYAHKDNLMVKDGEIPAVVVGDKSGAVISTPTPMPMPTPAPNWQVWWNLFFGER